MLGFRGFGGLGCTQPAATHLQLDSLSSRFPNIQVSSILFGETMVPNIEGDSILLLGNSV